MVTLAGKFYAKTESEFVGSLFSSSGTCAGYYKTRKNAVILMNAQKAPIAAAIRDITNGAAFFVSASQTETGIWFNYGISTDAEVRIGIDKLGYGEQRNAANQLLKDTGRQKVPTMRAYEVGLKESHLRQDKTKNSGKAKYAYLLDFSDLSHVHHDWIRRAENHPDHRNPTVS